MCTVYVCVCSGINSYRPFFRTPDINLVWDTGFFPLWPGVCLFAVIIGGVFVVVVVVVVAATLHLYHFRTFISVFFPTVVAPSLCGVYVCACVCFFARNNTQLATVYNLVVVK